MTGHACTIDVITPCCDDDDDNDDDNDMLLMQTLPFEIFFVFKLHTQFFRRYY